MKSDYNGLVEQNEMNQSVDENFNTEYVTQNPIVMNLICIAYKNKNSVDDLQHVQVMDFDNNVMVSQGLKSACEEAPILSTRIVL
jgi:hypothetical protein